MKHEVETTRPATAEPEPIRRRHVRWYHIVVLLLAMVIAGASFILMTSRHSDRDDAQASLQRAQHALATERSAVAHSRNALAAARANATTTVARMHDALATLHSIAALTPQAVDASRGVQQAAANNSIAELNNTALPHNDDVARQYTDLVNTLGPQLTAAMSDPT